MRGSREGSVENTANARGPKGFIARPGEAPSRSWAHVRATLASVDQPRGPDSELRIRGRGAGRDGASGDAPLAPRARAPRGGGGQMDAIAPGSVEEPGPGPAKGEVEIQRGNASSERLGASPRIRDATRIRAWASPGDERSVGARGGARGRERGARDGPRSSDFLEPRDALRARGTSKPKARRRLRVCVIRLSVASAPSASPHSQLDAPGGGLDSSTHSEESSPSPPHPPSPSPPLGRTLSARGRASRAPRAIEHGGPCARTHPSRGGSALHRSPVEPKELARADHSPEANGRSFRLRGSAPAT